MGHPPRLRFIRFAIRGLLILLCVFAAVALAYVLENLRPRLSRYSFATDDDDMPDEVVASSKVARMKRTRA